MNGAARRGGCWATTANRSHCFPLGGRPATCRKASRKSRGEPARGWPARVASPLRADGAGRARFHAENSRGRQRRPCSRSCSVMRRISTAIGSSRGARVSSGDDGDFTPRRLVADFSVDRAHSAPATSAATTTIHNTAETRPTTSPTGGRRCGGHAGRRGRAELAPAACSWRGVMLRPAWRVDDRVRYGRLGADRRRDSVTGRLLIVSAAVLVVVVAAAVWLAGGSGPEPAPAPSRAGAIGPSTRHGAVPGAGGRRCAHQVAADRRGRRLGFGRL